MDSNSGTFSIRSETKEKFDSLIKKALKESNSASKETPLQDTRSSEKNNDKGSSILSDAEEKASKKVILERFLHSSSNGNLDTVIFIKPPVPKPRKKTEAIRKDSSSSRGTIDVASPKILKKNNDETISQTSSDLGSNATFCVKKSESKDIELGHLELHNSPSTSKIIQAANIITKKGDIEDLSDKTYSKNSKEIHLQNTLEKNKCDEKNVIDTQTDAVEFVSENKRTSAKKSIRKVKEKSKGNVKDNSDAEIEKDCDKIVEIIIHKTDRIDLSAFIIHPVVKVHLVDINTGEYFKKRDKNRPVVFYYEHDENDYILPVMTTYYNLQENRTFHPMWEETILFNEDYNYLINDSLIIFFEILDFLPMYADINSVQKSCSNGWINVAFAFLKPIGKNNALNTNQKLRLQLYYPGTIKRVQDNKKCYVWKWWHKKKCKKYPSTLYVTVKDVISPKKIVETFRSKTPMQKEELSKLVSENECLKDDKIDISLKKWSKHEAKYFQFPSKCLAELPTFGDGCFILKFSNNGSYLAAAIKIEDIFAIILYCVENFEELTKFSCHQRLIYSINWSKDDSILITASGDNTLAIWDVHKKIFLQILPHPSYVYASDLTSDFCIATGCYDKILRIWRNQNTKYELKQELEGHTGYITSLCFNKLSSYLYSADSVGTIIEWKREENDFIFSRKIEISNIRGCIINEIILFPNEKKMLVHCRDSALRIIAIANSCVLHWLLGAQNTRVQTFCSISHCGNYVTSGNENGMVIIWNAKSGKDVKMYNVCPKLPTPIHCVRLHSKGNFMAMSHYGRNSSILIFGCEENSASQENSEINVVCKTKNVESEVSNNSNSISKKNLQLREILQKMDNMLK